MTRLEAIKIIAKHLKTKEATIIANGMISREMFAVMDGEFNFYMLGSMGMASSIGLGLALSKPNIKVVVLDGDGNLLMSFGVLANIVDAKIKNFLHIVLDNEAYESTGRQDSVTRTIDLAKIARSCGYKRVYKVSSPNILSKIIKKLILEKTLSFLLVKVGAKGKTFNLPRISSSPEAIKERFIRFLR